MLLHTAICDDARADCAFVNDLLRQWAAARGVEVRAECFSSAEQFLFRYAEDKSFDLLLLDIEMERMDGVTMARQIRCGNEAVQIVFITGFSDYIAEGYDVAALHYLMKPISREKFFAVLDRAAEKCRRNSRFLTLPLGGELVRIALYEIRYLDVHQNYVTIHAAREYTVKRTLSEFEKELGEGFFRAGRGLIVNLKDVLRVTKTDVHLTGGIVLPLPRGVYDAINRAIIRQT